MLDRFLLGFAVASTLISSVLVSAPSFAQGEARFELPSQPLAAALRSLGNQTKTNILFDPASVKNLDAPAVTNAASVEEALAAILAGSGLTYRFIDARTVTLIPAATATKAGRTTSAVTLAPSSKWVNEPMRLAQAESPANSGVSSRSEEQGVSADQNTGLTGAVQLDEVVVTGSHIRGVPSASTVISTTQEQIKSAGQTSLAEFVRGIPQNFSGGQNPGIGINVPESSGSNLGAGTALNLRGLGSDATLTLLNGHRLPHNASNQAIDLSAIPLAAVDRIEIVADGASALYGSDAVAGVANVILRRDYDGLGMTARVGASTDGGNDQQQYSVVAGTVWDSGGLMGVYDFSKNTQIMASHRSYAKTRSPGLTLFPELQQHSAMLTAHQQLTSNLGFSADVLYGQRASERRSASTAAGNYQIAGQYRSSESETFTIAPSLTLSLPGEWASSLVTTYGQDRTRYGSKAFSNSRLTSRTQGCYCNEAASAELNANGSIWALPGGDAKIAMGAGYRTNDFRAYRTIGSPQDISASQDTYYAFTEINLPLVSPEMEAPFAHALNMSAAVRYEDYPGVDHVVTPKVGVVYSLSPDFDFKASWGKSFKAPTLYQRYSSQYVEADFAGYYGGAQYPADRSALLFGGANPALKPERATTWSASLVFQPRALENARFELSYFELQYKDQVGTPISYLSQSLSNPVYQRFVTLYPTPEQQAAVIAGSLFFDYLPDGYDPADVVALINALNTNISRQSLDGVDLLVQYGIDLGTLGSLELSANGAYLDSARKVNDAQPFVQLAGTLFNPPRVRARGSVSWELGSVSMNSSVGYIGGVDDERRTPTVGVGSMTTWDWSGRYRTNEGPGLLDGLDIQLTVQNLFNEKPEVIWTSTVSATPYDSTNYSAVGRFIGLSVGKQW